MMVESLNLFSTPKVLLNIFRFIGSVFNERFFFVIDIPERKEKRYKEVTEAGLKIIKLVADSMKYFQADDNSHAWWDYLVRQRS